MRLLVQLLILGIALTGCNSSVESNKLNSVNVTSTPNDATIRINGSSIGHTPMAIELDPSKNYELKISKKGYRDENYLLKPNFTSNKTDSKFCFPESININLFRLPAKGEVGIPAADEKEFVMLAKKVLGEKAPPSQDLAADVTATKLAVIELSTKLNEHDAAYKARIEELNKNLAVAKAAKSQNEAAKSRLIEAKIALFKAEENAERVRLDKALKTAEARNTAFAGAKAKVVEANNIVAQVATQVKASDDRLSQLEQAIEDEIQSLKKSHNVAQKALLSINARADELNRQIKLAETKTNYDTDKVVADLRKELAQQKAAASKANEAAKQAQIGAAKTNVDVDKVVADLRKELAQQKATASKANETAKQAQIDASKAIENAKRTQTEAANHAASAANKSVAAARKSVEKANLEVKQLQVKLAKALKAPPVAIVPTPKISTPPIPPVSKKTQVITTKPDDAAIAKANEEVKRLQAKLDETIMATQNTSSEAKRNTAEAKKALDQAKKALDQTNAEVKRLKDQLELANKSTEKAVAAERRAAEAKLADMNKAAAEAKARAITLKYSEFSTRYALLESKRRAKTITEAEYQAALSALRKELEL